MSYLHADDRKRKPCTICYGKYFIFYQAFIDHNCSDAFHQPIYIYINISPSRQFALLDSGHHLFHTWLLSTLAFTFVKSLEVQTQTIRGCRGIGWSMGRKDSLPMGKPNVGKYATHGSCGKVQGYSSPTSLTKPRSGISLWRSVWTQSMKVWIVVCRFNDVFLNRCMFHNVSIPWFLLS